MQRLFTVYFPALCLFVSFVAALMPRSIVATFRANIGRQDSLAQANRVWRYLNQFIDKNGREAFEAQCIPTDPRLLEVGAYKQFLGTRRADIAKRLNEFLAPTTDSVS